MKNKIGPYLLLVALIVILVFIVGVRYGQKVEQTNKAINYVLSITPVISPTPTVIQYKTYESKKLKIKITYPSTLQIKEDATKSAILLSP